MPASPLHPCFLRAIDADAFDRIVVSQSEVAGFGDDFDHEGLDASKRCELEFRVRSHDTVECLLNVYRLNGGDLHSTESWFEVFPTGTVTLDGRATQTNFCVCEISLADEL